MIQRIKKTFKLNEEQRNFLNKKKPFEKGDWEKYKRNLGIYDSILNQLNDIQKGKCCYCGLKYNTTGRPEVEHIAPKGAQKSPYPEYSFTKKNIAIACQNCNSPNKKGQYNSIRDYSKKYSDCTFKIVHPYFDEPNRHYGWRRGFLEIVISGKTPEGLESIRLFDLTSPELTEARAGQKNMENLRSTLNISQTIINRIKTIVSFKRISN